MKIALLVIILTLAAQLVSRAEAPDISDAPKSIQDLVAGIQGKSPAEVRAAIIERFGSAQRNVGSGVDIEQWDAPEGVLTFNSISGPTFSDRKSKKRFWLIRTKNSVRTCIFQSYEMTALPINGSYWLGEVKFAGDMTYRFTYSRQNLSQRHGQADNFFLLHPTGKFEVSYPAPVTADTLLESLPEGTVIAHLTFTSAGGKHQASFSITSSEQSRSLDFSADKALPFLMNAGWKNFWR